MTLGLGPPWSQQSVHWCTARPRWGPAGKSKTQHQVIGRVSRGLLDRDAREAQPTEGDGKMVRKGICIGESSLEISGRLRLVK